MDFIDNIAGLSIALQEFVFGGMPTLTTFHQDKLLGAVIAINPVDRICNCAEALYAARADLDDAGRALCAQLAAFAARNGFYALDVDNRGGRIAQAMQRDMKLKPPVGKWPSPKTDPEPLAEFVEQAALEGPDIPQ